RVTERILLIRCRAVSWNDAAVFANQFPGVFLGLARAPRPEAVAFRSNHTSRNDHPSIDAVPRHDWRLGVGVAEVTAYSHHAAPSGAGRLEVLQSLDLASAHQPGPPEHLHDAEELDDRAARDIVLGPSQGCIPQQLCIEAPIFREVCGLGALTESCVSLDR